MAELLRSNALGRVPHGFSARAGASADDVIPGSQLVTVKQVHSPDVVEVTEAWDKNAAVEADAMVTNRPGLILGIVTADCAPVLLFDSHARIIGAAHAGWRGAASGVIANTVAAMEKIGASRANIVAAIGPCIAQQSYEVDTAMKAEFSAEDACFFAAGKPGHWQFDLPGFVASQLTLAGITQVDDLGLDTYANAKRFYSFRRSTHRDEPTGGRQISLIGLRASE
ncbi:peptidoglycan editing factor PgeF [Erythrobacter sp. W53]|uniref:peptidoglycan editing factor PgeF n=1 Tax=Erythrobacter sp. W53 TaxID=3425947 RepID=UPI003D7690B5